MKNKHITSALSLITAAVLLMSPLNALSYSGLGEITSFKRDTIGDGLTYTEYTSTDANGKSQNSYIFDYDPAGGVLPVVSYGSTVYGKDRLGTLVSSKWSDKLPVLAAVNGDFYSMQTGVPLGVMIENGQLVSTDDSKYAIGFKSDGTAVIGKPSVKLSLTNLTRGGSPVEIDQLNKFPTIWGVYLVTDDFASTTLSSSESLEIVIDLTNDIRASGSVTGYVREIITGDCNTSIPKGGAVLTVANTYEDYPLFAGIRVGDKLSIDSTCDPFWTDVVTAIGGGDMILDNGTMPAGIINEDHEKVSNPRTAAGIKADGTVVFFAVDGRTTSSRGLTVPELSAVMAELGCVRAVNFDGGGSTSVMVKTSNSSNCVYVNAPSDGSYRSVANGILLVGNVASDGVGARLSAVPNTPYVLRGSTVSFSAQVLDRAYMPTGTLIGSDALTIAFKDITAYPENAGSVAGSSFTAGEVPGEYRFILSAQNGSHTLTGEVSAYVTDTIDSLNVASSYIKAAPGSLLDLGVSASYKGRSVLCDAGAFYYTLNGTHEAVDQAAYPGAMLLCDVGYLDNTGRFQTFGNATGEVEVGIWYKEYVRYITIKVGTGSDTIADFEDPAQIGNLSLKAGTTVSDLRLAAAANGYKSAGSLAIGYTFKSDAVSRLLDVNLNTGFPISPDAKSIKLWVSGDVSGTMTAAVADGNGNRYDLSYVVTKDYSKQLGWRELTAEIPVSLKNGTLTLVSLLSVNDLGSGSRTLKLDNAIVYYGEEAVSPFADLNGHWAKDYILNLYDMEAIEDSDCEPNGDLLSYSPDKALTRGEFAKLLVRYLGLDTSPFKANGLTLETDTPADKVVYIRTAIANGLMNGYGTDALGVTIFKSEATITRQEAFKVIGLLVTGTESPLKFKDVLDVADWAYSGIAKCVTAGIVKGYEDNTIRPNATISRAEFAAILSRVG